MCVPRERYCAVTIDRFSQCSSSTAVVRFTTKVYSAKAMPALVTVVVRSNATDDDCISSLENPLTM